MVGETGVVEGVEKGTEKTESVLRKNNKEFVSLCEEEVQKHDRRVNGPYSYQI